MPANNLHPASFYLSRLQDLPAAYLRAVNQLKSEVSSHRLMMLPITDICARMQLDAANMSCRSFTAQSQEIYAGLGRLLEHFGLKLAPFTAPVGMAPDQEVVLTMRPNLHNDEDISYVQSLLKSGRELRNRDMVFVSRMQEKLADYNILLRVMEGLSAFSRRELNVKQLTYLNELIHNLLLPIEGANYLKACYTFLCRYPAFKIDFGAAQYLLKPLEKAEQQQLIVRYLAEIAAREPVRMNFDPHFPMFEDLNANYLKLAPAHARLYEPAEGELSDRAAEPRARSIVKKAQQTHKAAQLLALRVQKGTWSGSAGDSEAFSLIQTIAAHLRADSSLTLPEIAAVSADLKQEINLLALCPHADKLCFSYLNGRAPSRLENSLSIITGDAYEKQLYPYFIFSDGETVDLPLNDIAQHHFFREPFTASPSAFITRSDYQVFIDYAALLTYHYLLLRPLLSGYDKICTCIFNDICSCFTDCTLKCSPDLPTVCTLFYILYREKLPKQQPMPELVLDTLARQPVLLAFYAKDLLGRSNLQLKGLDPQELEVVGLYIYTIISIANPLANAAHFDFKNRQVRSLFLPLLSRLCLSMEQERGAPLFTYAADNDQHKCYYEVNFLDCSHLFESTLFNSFMRLLPTAMIKSRSADGQLPLIALKYDKGYTELLTKIAEHQEISDFLHSAKGQVHPRILQALTSASDHVALLNSLFDKKKPMDLDTVLSRFWLPPKYSSKPIFDFILRKANVYCLPDDPLLFRSLSAASPQMFCMDGLSALSVKEDREFKKILICGQLSLHLFWSACKSISVLSAAMRQIVDLLKLPDKNQRSFALQYYQLFLRMLDANHQLPLGGIKRYYRSQLTKTQFQTGIERLKTLVRMALSGGTQAAQFKKFEKLFTALSLNRRELFALTRPDKPKTPDFAHLDQSLIKSKLQESSEVLDVIGQIKQDADGEEELSAGAPETEAQTVTAAKEAAQPALGPDGPAPAACEPAAEDEGSAQNPGDKAAALCALLDLNALDLLKSIKSQRCEIMDLNEFSGLCLSARFMSCPVAVEMLNDFAYAHFDEPIFDLAPEENSVYISQDLIAQLLPDEQ